MKALYSIIALTLLVSSADIANHFNYEAKKSEVACKGFLPKNKLYISPTQKSRFGGIDEAKFNAVIEAVEEIYIPIVKSKGGNLKINRLWDNGTVNANASRQGSTYVVNMYGGLARHAAVTAEGFAVVVCHEIGHHIGGAPVYGGGGWGGGGSNSRSWASNEGQSDYFATSKCLRKVFRNFNNFAALKRAYNGIPDLVQKACKNSFPNNADALICMRSAMGGLSLANLFKALRNLPKAPDFSTPDTKVVAKTSDDHPQPQCRLDTYFQGAICGEDDRTDLGYDDETQGACARTKGNKVGIRPLCWYKPQAKRFGNPLALNF